MVEYFGYTKKEKKKKPDSLLRGDGGCGWRMEPPSFPGQASKAGDISYPGEEFQK